ncbi:MAG TPA: hypothetical protein VLM43_03790, partial [Desulfobacterales bacterium]|nr:hypothetical protein [Desulfobacterales bacterium]
DKGGLPQYIASGDMIMKNLKTIKGIENRVAKLNEIENLNVHVGVTDISIQTEQRLEFFSYAIFEGIDQIKFPKSLSGCEEGRYLHMRCEKLRWQIRDLGKIHSYTYRTTIKSNIRKKGELELRKKRKAEFMLENANLFLAGLGNPKPRIKQALSQIKLLQAEQKNAIKELRAHNSKYLADVKKINQERKEADKLAMSEGRFWDASEAMIKEYFKPPFSKNNLADVSKKWRAALFLEVESQSAKKQYGDKGWIHRMVATGKGYLCGIDDNGDEWGHEVELYEYLSGNPSQYFSEYAYDMDGTVEYAMSYLFGTRVTEEDSRQGDLLFQKVEIPEYVELEDVESIDVRESHRIRSSGMLAGESFFKCDLPIIVEHSSHKTLILDPGSYRVFMLDWQYAEGD